MTIIFKNSIQDGTKFYYQCQRYHLMMSWKVSTNWGYESLRNSKTVQTLHEMEIHQKISMPNCQKLKTETRSRNFDGRHGRIESGALTKSRKRLIGVEGGKGTCYQWKEKGQCSQEDRCSFRHETQDRAQKPEHTAATLSEPTASRGRSVCRVSEAKVTIGPFFDNRADIIWKVPASERLVNIGIRPSANFTKQKWVARPETSVCFRITRLMNKHIKKQKKSNITKRRESDDKNAVASVQSVSQLGCVSQDSDALVSERDKQARGNPM